jgi:hypothetical protein
MRITASRPACTVANDPSDPARFVVSTTTSEAAPVVVDETWRR